MVSRPELIRAGLKARFERGLRTFAVRSLRRGGMGGRRLVLAYHGIRPSGEAPAGERVLHLEQARLSEQLDELAELAEVVPLGTLLDPTPSENTRPRVAITWDDAYAGAVAIGLDALVSRGMPSTLFVAPGRLGGHAFWWDRLAAKHEGAIPGTLRNRVLGELAGDEERIAVELQGLSSPNDIPEWAKSADPEVLARSAERPGVTIASHSWSHVNLDAMHSARLEDELRRPLAWLGDRFPCAKPWLALPYGLGSTMVRRRAVDLGYAAVLRIRGGWIPPGPLDLECIPRLNVPAGLSTAGFVLRLRGLFAS